MAKVDCSELSKLLTEMAMIHATQPNVKSLDDVVGLIHKDFPQIQREDLVDAIVESTTHQTSEMDDLTKKLVAIRREARSDKALKTKINELEHYIEAGEFPSSAKKNNKTVPEPIEHLRDIRDDLKRKITKSEPAQAKRLQDSIDTLEKRIETGDITPKTKIKPETTKTLERLEYEKKKLQNEIRYKIQMMKPRSLWEKVAEPWNMFRALMTGGEFSLVLRQGGWTAVSRPGTMLKSLPGMFKAFASEQAAYKISDEIDSRPNAPLYAKAGLHISPVDGSARLTKLEEVYMSHWIEKVPVIKNFQRAGITFLNLVRANSFDLLSKTLPVDSNGIANNEELKAIGNYINVNTGRGNLGAMEQAAVALNTVFFAPKYVASRFQLLLGQPLWKGTMNTRKIIAGEYARALTGMFAVMLLGALAGGDIEDDPRSSDFGKIRFGRTRLDPLFGLSQTVVLLARVISGKTKTSKGDLKALRGEDVPYGGGDVWDVSARFLRTKFSPMISTTFDFFVGENVVGQEVTLKNYVPKLVVPLAYRDIYDVFRDQDISHATAMSILVMFGTGLQTYGTKLEDLTNKKINAEIRKYNKVKGAEEYVNGLKAEKKRRLEGESK